MAAMEGRFSLGSTPRLQQLLELALQQTDTSKDLKELCQQCVDQDAIPWRVVQRVCTEVRKNTLQTDQASLVLQPATHICEGAKLLLPSPPARQRSQQLVERLTKIQNQVDEDRYAAMVADVTHQEQQAAAQQQDPFFPTTRLQLSFGLHVLVTMGTFCALGYYAGRLLFKHETWAALLAAVGLSAGLLLESVLLILRTNMPAAPLDKKYAHLLDKRWDQPGSNVQRPGSAAAGKQQHPQLQQGKDSGSSKGSGGGHAARLKAD